MNFDLKFIISFKVLGQPVAMARPRMTKSGRVYIPKKSNDHMKLIATTVKELGFPEIKGPVKLIIDFYHKRPKTMKGDKQKYKVTRPDLDNLIKCVCDGVTKGYGWKDDSQVCNLSAHDYYCGSDDQPRTIITIFEIIER